jgi:hypothetical protein
MVSTDYNRGGLNALYFSNISQNAPWGNADLQRVDGAVNFNWGRSAVAANVSNDNFGAVWQGKIQAAATGWTKFFTTADDGVVLKVGGQTLINQWRDQPATEYQGGLWLQAGQLYDIEVAYYERSGNAVMQLAWEAPGQAKEIVNPWHLFHNSKGTVAPQPELPNPNITAIDNGRPIDFKEGEQRFGINTTIYDASGSMTGGGLVQSVDFNFNSGAPIANTAADNFRLDVSGRLSVQRSGQYSFFTTADDQIRFTIDGQTLVNHATARPTQTYQSNVWLDAGKSYFFSANYQDLGGSSNLKIEWSGADTNGQRQILTERNVLTLSDRLPTNVHMGNMFEAYDRTQGNMDKLRQLYPNPLFF